MVRYRTELLFMFTVIMSTAFAQHIPIHQNWTFREYNKGEWLKAQVPGQVHTDLLSLNRIDDPFQYSNDKNVQWIGFKDWEYKTEFDSEKAVLNKSHIELVFPGLDTYADVYLNDFLVLEADNMFRTWRIDVKNYLKEKGNTLRIHFRSVYKVDMPKYLNAPFQLQAWPNNDQSDIYLSLYARKAGYNYGWDWGPRLLTCGIWKEPYMETWDRYRIIGVQIVTKSLKGKSADMSAYFEVESDADVQNVSLQVDKHASRTVNLEKGYNKFEVDFSVKSPKLWWSRGLGEQHLYAFDCFVSNDNHKVSETITTGIRTIEIIREKDKDGQSLFVKLNGRNVFMKGANYVPLDNFPNRVSDAHYEHIIRSAAEANMNMLRVWGGGIYEKDIFYELCDKYGILVWQDMMFACGMFPADRYYLDNVYNEVADNVRRLRNHPSIALWNGNNENEISYFEWGWRNKMAPENDRVYQGNLKKLFYDVIPSAINSVDASRYYHPTSPNTGYNDMGYNMGDVHLWSVWKGGDVEDYLVSVGRFMSEYGFQSYPDMFTIKKFTSKWDWDLDSPVMLSHQRARNDETRDPHFGNNMMKQYMDKYFTTPEDFEDFVYMSQYQQAEIVKVALESHRRHKPYCMGTLYWQINDCWPVASWSSIDYYGRWKALHYYAKKAFNDILISPYADGGQMKVKIISDRDKSVKGKVEIKVLTLDGQVLFYRTMPVFVEADACRDIFQFSYQELFSDMSTAQAFVHVKFTDEGGTVLSENEFYPAYANKYVYSTAQPSIAIEQKQGGYTLKLESTTLVRGLYVYTDDGNNLFSDNYLTLLPHVATEIDVKSGQSLKEFENQLKFKSYNQIKK